MKSTIFIPEKMKAGFVERKDTFTGKLAYIIYYDAKNKLRKETSWNGWRSKDIDPIDFYNVPTTGFVLNKKVGGYSTGWNHRQTYCRVYDPRGIEFEISIPNLLFILENTNSIKGKGLEGEFVYGMDGKDLLLIPCDSPDYKEIKDFNSKVKNKTKFTMKNMIEGATYLNKDNKSVIYMGRFDAWKHAYNNRSREKEKSKKYFFCTSTDEKAGFTYVASVGQYLLECLDENSVSDYANLFDKMEYCEAYNPYNPSKDEYVNHTLESFTKHVMNQVKNRSDYTSKYYNYQTISFDSDQSLSHGFIYSDYSKCSKVSFYWDTNTFKWTRHKTETDPQCSWRNNRVKVEHEMDIREFFQTFTPRWIREYLADGKLRRELLNE